MDAASCQPDGTCQCSNRARFFIGIGVYVAMLVGVAVYSRISSQRAGLLTTDKFRDHFLASNQFGIVVTTLSIFSTAFSGYSVVGVPQEASITGFKSLRWLGLGVFVNLGCMLIFPRLRKIGESRKYNSPTDLVVDRFNCNSLRLLSSLALVIPLFIYTTVQFKALADILEGLSLGRIDRHTGSWILCTVIILCEQLGGQRSVTISDTIQAGVMLLAFVVMPFVLVHKYGGLSEIVESGCDRTYTDADGHERGCAAYSRPWFTRTPTVTTECNYNERFTDSSCLSSHYDANTTVPWLQPWFANRFPVDKYPSLFGHVTLSMWMFNINAIAFALTPHFMQKVFIAKTDRVLKHSLMLMTLAGLVANLPGVYYGIVRAAAFDDDSGKSAFAVVTGNLIDSNGFAEIVAVIASCSALAAIMSTADSTIIGANNILTVEWVKYFFWKGASISQLQVISKVVTAAFAVGALLFSFSNYVARPDSYGSLINLQNSFVWQPFPTYMVAMHTDRVAAYPLLLGMIAGLITTLLIEVNQDDTSGVPSGLIALVVNVAVVAAAQVTLRIIGSSLAEDDTRKFDTVDPNITANFGSSRLKATYIKEHIMNRTIEPLASRQNQLLMALALLLLSLGHPWYSPPYTEQNVSSGLTRWAAGYFASYILAVAIVLLVYYRWDTGEEVIAGESALRRQVSHERSLKMQSTLTHRQRPSAVNRAPLAESLVAE